MVSNTGMSMNTTTTAVGAVSNITVSARAVGTQVVQQITFGGPYPTRPNPDLFDYDIIGVYPGDQVSLSKTPGAQGVDGILYYAEFGFGGSVVVYLQDLDLPFDLRTWEIDGD